MQAPRRPGNRTPPGTYGSAKPDVGPGTAEAGLLVKAG